ncbi:MAG TPA: hypothetical protein VL285_18635 [Bryobacteraceae bacterium]|nr:hypothetical protein [Bryobacteraceae bacterium]
MLDRSATVPIRTVVPWYIWSCVIAVTSGSVGGVWDISWHKSIGRDSFWTPAHVMIYLCGVIAGLTCGYVILATTFGRNPDLRVASVKVWGFHGPLGAFLCAWGGIAMITSAPFDDWWHNAYGLDVKVLSPPHVVLMFGLIAIRLGTLLFVLGELNRARGRSRAILNGLLLYMFMCILAITLGAFQEITIRTNMHSARFYLVVALAAPLWLAAVTRLSTSRWACTIVAAIYTCYYLTFIWILPLFPAAPKLGPVYQDVTRLTPPDFPQLLLAPALALDLFRRGAGGWSRWRYSMAAGCLFVAAFAAAQWPFAGFLQSPGARNWFFGVKHLPFFVPSGADYARYLFTALEKTRAEFWLIMGLAAGAAVVTTRLGLGMGAGLSKLRR